MYGTRDKTSGKILNRATLTSNYGLRVNFEDILINYQDRITKTSARIEIKVILQFLGSVSSGR